MLKKLIAGALCGALILSQCALSASAFADVDKNAYSWATTQIEEMTEMKIINGFEDGTFRPAEGVTRVDSLLLISRILGSNSATEQKIVDFAENIYFKDVNVLQYPAYQKTLAYLIYRDVFTPSALANFLQTGQGSKPLARHEAAVLLVKMGNDTDKISKDKDIELPFVDAEEIPKSARPYVLYCYQNGLMKGMDGNRFAPNEIVTRAQMAVMLYNAMKSLNLTTVTGTVEDVSGFNNAITYVDEFGETETLNNTGDIRFTLDGEDIDDIEAIAHGDVINVQYRGKNVYMVEAMSVLKDETIEGFYAGKGASSTIQKILVRGTEEGAKTTGYILDEDYKVYLNNEEVKLSELQSGDRIKLTIRDSRVTIINAAARETTIKGYINGFDYKGKGSIDVKLSNNEVKTYAITEDNVVVKRNEEKVTLRDLKVGDKVTVNLEFDIIVAISATSVEKIYEGTIEEIVISSTNPAIKIDIGNEVIECAMDNSIAVTINGEEASVYDMRLGYTATVKTDSSTVVEVKITSTPAVENINVMGTVTEVNTNYSSITLQLSDGTYQTLFVKSGATILNGNTGKKITLAAIEKGSLLTAVVSSSGFTAEAISIVVLSN